MDAGEWMLWDGCWGTNAGGQTRDEDEEDKKHGMCADF